MTLLPRGARALDAALVVAAFAGTLLACLLGLASASAALLLFWLESALVLAIGAVAGLARGQVRPLALGLFFGFFLFVHLQFLLAMAAEESGDPFAIFSPTFALDTFLPLLLPGLAILAGHVAAAIAGRAPDPDDPGPVARVLLLHVALVFGGFASFALGTALPALVLLTALRLVVQFVPPPVLRRRLPGPWAALAAPPRRR